MSYRRVRKALLSGLGRRHARSVDEWMRRCSASSEAALGGLRARRRLSLVVAQTRDGQSDVNARCQKRWLW
jgi:hypothetical protein